MGNFWIPHFDSSSSTPSSTRPSSPGDSNKDTMKGSSNNNNSKNTNSSSDNISYYSSSSRATLKEGSMRRQGDNQMYFVLGHKTPNIRGLYTIGRKLGQGQFGTTYLCTEIRTGIEYACKSIPKRNLIGKEHVEDVRREIQIMHHLSGHKNIVAIKGAYEDSFYVHIVMELCAEGKLFDWIIRRGHCSEREAAELTRIIVGVVEACHSLGVMHRDLKLENFLVVNKDDDSWLKAFDFRHSVFFKPGQVFKDVVGSPYYVAPEVLRKHYGPEADVWTAGVILYILLSGVLPFWAETRQGIFDAVLKGVIDFESDPWPLISDGAKDLIKKMLRLRPSDRLTAHEVLCHPWICENVVAPCPDRALDPAVLSRLKQFSAMNKLKKMALRVIAESLSEEEIAGLKEMFLAMDTDYSGAITFDELKTGLKRYGSTLKESEIRALMDAADVDNSGTIDWWEFIAATVHLNKLERVEHLIAAFNYFDKDRTGYITVDELQQACHPWICENVVAPYQALDPAALSCLKQFSAMNKLKKMALRVIAESLSEEEIAGLKEMLQAMDTDNSGAITFDELKAGLERYGSTLKESEIRALMDAADVDNSGTIDWWEFIAATVHLNKLEREEHLIAAFKYFDKDCNGYITVDELQQACKEHNMGNVLIEDIIEEVDQDNDGRIDYGDFVAMMQNGNAGIGRRTMHNSLNISMRDVPGAR